MLSLFKTAFRSDECNRNIYNSVKKELQLNRFSVKSRSRFPSAFPTRRSVLRLKMSGAEDCKQVVNAQLSTFKSGTNLSANNEKCKNDANILEESGRVSGRKSRGNTGCKQNVVCSRQSKMGTVIQKDDIMDENAINIDDGEHDSFVQAKDSIEQGSISYSQSRSRKRKTLAKTSKVTEVKAVVDSELKHEVIDPENKEEPWTMLVHKKLQPHWTSYNPALMRKPTPSGNSVKLLSWNVNGLRALLNKKCFNAIGELAKKENFDVLCLQETKLQVKDVDPIKESLLSGYEHSFWNCSTTKLGYSGTAIISRIKPISVNYGLGSQDHDCEGRIITLEFDKFYLIAGYVPNSGQKLERLAYRTKDWDICLGRYVKDLEKRKPVILAGDLNCAHQEIDIYNPDGNRKSAGFTNEERNSFEENFLTKGFIDTFRRQHEHVVAYTYWGYRTAARPKNQGWRLDYFLVSCDLLDLVYDSYIIPDIAGSDHCPIGLILKA